MNNDFARITPEPPRRVLTGLNLGDASRYVAATGGLDREQFVTFHAKEVDESKKVLAHMRELVPAFNYRDHVTFAFELFLAPLGWRTHCNLVLDALNTPSLNRPTCNWAFHSLPDWYFLNIQNSHLVSG